MDYPGGAFPETQAACGLSAECGAYRFGCGADAARERAAGRLCRLVGGKTAKCWGPPNKYIDTQRNANAAQPRRLQENATSFSWAHPLFFLYPIRQANSHLPKLY